MSEESKKGIYDQSSFDAIKPSLDGTKPKYSATPLENWNDAPGRRDAQFENHCLTAIHYNLSIIRNQFRLYWVSSGGFDFLVNDLIYALQYKGVRKNFLRGWPETFRSRNRRTMNTVLKIVWK